MSTDENPFSRSMIFSHSPPTDLTTSGANCHLCNEPNSQNMVTCNECRQVFHCKCVGITTWGSDSVKWNCRTCVKKLKHKASSQRHPSQSSNTAVKLGEKTASAPQLNIVGTTTTTIENNPKLTQPSNPVNTVALPMSGVITTRKEDKPNENCDLNESRGQKMTQIRPSTSMPGHTIEKPLVLTQGDDSSKGSRRSKQRAKEIALAKHAEWAELQKRLFEEKWKILEDLETSSSESAGSKEENADNGRVMEWVESQNQSKVTFNLEEAKATREKSELPVVLNQVQVVDVNAVHEAPITYDEVLNDETLERTLGKQRIAETRNDEWIKPLATPVSTKRFSQSHDNLSRHQSQTNPNVFRSHLRNNEPLEGTSLPWLNARNQQEFMNSTSFQRTPNEDEAVNISLKQIAIRQVVTKDLPTFTGDPTEWPMFISAYVRSTKICGFSDEENLIRLQKSLKGKALSAVRSKLLLPSTVPHVLNTLRMLFGRPDLILQRLIDQVRCEPNIHPEKLEMLIEFSMSVQHLCALMEASGMQDHLNNPILLQELVEKLPGSMKLRWATYKMNFKIVNLSNFNDWLYQLAEAAGSVITTKPLSLSRLEDKPIRRPEKHRGTLHAAHVQTQNKTVVSATKKNCIICENTYHKVFDCPKFRNFTASERWKSLREKKLCRKCLGSHHVSKCKSIKDCGQNGCPFKHHPLLHDTAIHTTSSIPTYSSTEPKPSTSSNIIGTHHSNTTILSRIVPVVLHGKSLSLKTFAFLDDGSHLTLIDEEIARNLQLEGPKDDLCLQWTSNLTRTEKKSMKISLDISGVNDNQRFRMDGVYTVKALNLPSQTLSFDVTKYKHLQDLPIVQYGNAKPRIIIGLAHAGLTTTLQLREGHFGEPVAARTRLGWTIYGTTSTACSTDVNQVFLHGFHRENSNTKDEILHQLVGDFFSLENFGVHCPTKRIESVEDERARHILEKTTVLKGKRYETGLIWRYDDMELPDSYSMAYRRLINLENKMGKDPFLAKALHTEIKKYFDCGYARLLTLEEIRETDKRTWYLPIFAVKNLNKPEKTRIVWDAAAEVRGISLNSALLKGPDFLIALPDILLRFREHAVALSGDIEKMFHQITMREQDQNSQRFLLRNGNQQRKPDVFVMTVMTFGASSSPSSAHFVKNTNAKRFSKEHPRAVQEIIENHYVDDWITSFQNEDEAIQIAREVINIHSAGGFHIRNWASNSERVLVDLGEKTSMNDGDLVTCDEYESRILGMRWSAKTDSFFFRLNAERVDADILNGKRPPTKREVLRTLMLVFDPLGLIAFFLVFLKILLQRIWKAVTDWDQPISEEHNTFWKKWVIMLPHLAGLQIPRCVFPTQPEEVQLHIFVDASDHAYSALAYFRIRDVNGLRCVLICGKTKVAPLKIVSIPRLELLAAVLGSRLATWICQAHTIKPTDRHFWSDSQNVLCWIRSEEKRYRQFVAFRVAEILEATNIKEWRWVPTRENVADEATKWKGHPEINRHSRWFQGPEFLLQPEEKWPTSKLHVPADDPEEIRPHLAHLISKTSSFVTDIQRFSKYRRLLRCVAWALRFFYKCKKFKVDGPLKPHEIERAEMEMFRQAQIDGYSNEIIMLNQNPNESLNPSSSLYKLVPFLDKNQIIRQKGRISRSEIISYDAKNPIILPADHQITRLLIEHYHVRFYHQNHETVVNEIRQRFQISRLRAILKKVRYNCQVCKNSIVLPQPPVMAEHPPARLAAYSAPFTFVGIDLFGPYEIIVGRHVEKRWPILFTCLTVRAVHIEIAHSLDKHSVIMGIRNFMARRGSPKEFRTDNGTNFHGANNEFKRLWKEHADELQEHFDLVKWIFNPPIAPHMGGCWERLIRSVKKCLAAAMPMRRPNDEIFRCFLMEAENMVNSRPLTYIPLETPESEALTPNHFLIGSSSGIKPLGQFNDDVYILRQNYKISQRMADHFWRRWVREYMPDLTRTTKWYRRVHPIIEGDIVLIVNENKRSSWQKAIVVKTWPGRDGNVRRVTLKTADGILDRPAAKVAVLDVRKTETNGTESPQQGGECYDRNSTTKSFSKKLPM